MRKLLVATFVALLMVGLCGLLSGCLTPYQRVGLTGGYDEVQLAENMYRVSFVGNGYTSSDRATNLCMPRQGITINNKQRINYG